jgi:hypothetical protein
LLGNQLLLAHVYSPDEGRRVVRIRHVLAAVLAGAVTLGACTGREHDEHSRPHPPPALRGYRVEGLSFTYPAEWNLAESGPVAPIAGEPYPVVCVGTQLASDCTFAKNPLPNNGVGVIFAADEHGFGSAMPKPPVTSPMASCSGTADDSRTAQFHVALNPYVTRSVFVLACWRGPAATATARRVQAMLASVTVSGPEGAAFTPSETTCFVHLLPVLGAASAPGQAVPCSQASGKRPHVPDVVGVSLARAVALLNQVGLVVAVKPEQGATMSSATVGMQDPGAPSIVSGGSTVVLLVSRG